MKVPVLSRSRLSGSAKIALVENSHDGRRVCESDDSKQSNDMYNGSSSEEVEKLQSSVVALTLYARLAGTGTNRVF